MGNIWWQSELEGCVCTGTLIHCLDNAKWLHLLRCSETICYQFTFFFPVLDLHCCVGLSLVVVSRGYSLSWGVWPSHCADFSCCRAQSLRHTDLSNWSSGWGSEALEHTFNSCGTILAALRHLGSSQIRDQTQADFLSLSQSIGKPYTL